MTAAAHEPHCTCEVCWSRLYPTPAPAVDERTPEILADAADRLAGELRRFAAILRGHNPERQS